MIIWVVDTLTYTEIKLRRANQVHLNGPKIQAVMHPYFPLDDQAAGQVVKTFRIVTAVSTCTAQSRGQQQRWKIQ